MTFLWVRRRKKALFRLTPGNLPSGSTFTRSTTATYTDASGIVRTAAINTLRSGHYIGGVQSILLEGARTNSALWSSDLTNAAWTKTGTGTATQNAVGLDGTAASATTLADTDAAGLTKFGPTALLAIANDAAVRTLAVWFRKDADQTRFPQVQFTLGAGATPVTRVFQINTQTGALSAAVASTGTGTGRVVDAGLWWVLEITLTNNTTGNITANYEIGPASGTVFGAQSLAATGSCVVGQVQVELNAGFMSSPIFTTGAAVTRGADSLSFPYSAPPQAMTVYAKLIDLGTRSASGRYLDIGNNGNDFNSLALYSGTSGLTAFYGNSSVFSQPADAGTITIGDTIEPHVTLTAAGALTTGLSNGGGAETTTGPAAAAALNATFAAPIVYVGSKNVGTLPGFFALQSLKFASGVRSLAEMRNL